MPDSIAGEFMCQNDTNMEVLVDAGYSSRNPKFIKPPGDSDPLAESHKENRAIVEHFFGRQSLLWKMAGGCFRRKSKRHAIVLRCTVILTNMSITEKGGLKKFY